MRVLRRFALCPPAALLLAGCNPAPPGSTGGTDVAAGPFGRGVVTVNNDDSYGSTNVSLVGLDGSRLSQSFLSSKDLLSGDVAAPSSPSTGEDVVILDRFHSIVTWASVRTGQIRSQFHADGDGLARNVWDYLEGRAAQAYVTRYDPSPGKGTNGDLVVVDPGAATVLTPVKQRIDVASALAIGKDYQVHPARGVVVGDRAFVTLVVATPDYAYGDSYVVALDTATDEVVASRALDGLHDCIGIAPSPSGDEIAVTCSGDLLADAASDQTTSGLVLLAPSDLAETKRFPAKDLAKGPLGYSVTYASERVLLFTTIGNADDSIDDTAVRLDLDSGDRTEIHHAAPVEIGAVLCPARVDGGSDGGVDPPVCFVTDATKGVLVRFPADHGALGDPSDVVVDEIVGLPPRYLGQF